MTTQRTLKNSFTLQGRGFHTGLNITITFNPAPENYGYKIRRTDIAGQPIINALAENVSAAHRVTVLSANNVQVGMVEHALAALYACEIDNCLIDVDAPEFPVMDGSSILYVSKIKEVGAQDQNAERKFLTFKRKKIKVVDKTTGASMLLLPDESFSIQSHTLFDSPLLKQQDANMNSLNEFTREIAAARSFVFVKEIEPLLNKNLIRGGDLDNAIVIYDTPIEQSNFDHLADIMGIKRKDANKLGYITNKPLLYSNEPARHRLLDIVGDLALVGHFIKGKIIANSPGHTINNLFARAIREAITPSMKNNSNLQNRQVQAANIYI